MLKRLLNLSESETDRRLREVCEDFNAKVYAKVRVADVLPIESSGIDSDSFRFALQAHFDFVVTDFEDQALLAVEFDGPSHSTPDARTRDRTKDTLCDRFELPLLRINRKYLSPAFSSWDLLRWFCTVFFVKRAWDEDVRAGLIAPEDSVFDPMFVSVNTRSGSRSLELERDARAGLGQLFQVGEIPFYVPNWITAEADDRTLRALSWIKTSDHRGVAVETAMQCQYLGSWVQFAIRGIVLSQLHSRVEAVVHRKERSIPIEELDERVKRFEYRFRTLMSLRSSG